uniref:DUF5672 domain-containing protein n=1 Tax=viral metagenome TaxID=1070528 RepID=A0A6C0JIC2_9ZZZZ
MYMYTAVIVEPRRHRALSFVLKNYLHNLSNEWNIMLFHGTDNIGFIKGIMTNNLTPEESTRIVLKNLDVSNLESNDYNKLLTSVEFYEKIPTETILIFQTDSMIIPKNKDTINEFLKFEYVGAPWPSHLHWPTKYDYIGNGGLSLRKKSKMIEIIKKNGFCKENEDGYFADKKNGLLKPDYETAKRFAMETVFSEHAFGCHSPWKYQDKKVLFEFCPEIECLNNLQGVNEKRVFITFGAGGQNYIDSGNRLLKQCSQLGLFDKTILYTDADLKEDSEFWSKHGQFIESNSRGFGYWLWKPWIIKKTMATMQDGDILVYADAGCEIDITKGHILQKLFDEIKTKYIIGSKTCYEKSWTKMDLIMHLNMVDHPLLDIRQHQATTNIYRVCSTVRNFVNDWYEIGCNYHLIDDSPSVSPNLDVFIEHRHDQSIFSLLSKKMGIYDCRPLDQAILIKRNKTGKSMINA